MRSRPAYVDLVPEPAHATASPTPWWKFFAPAGALSLAVIFVNWGAWIASGPSPSPTGPSAFPTSKLVILRSVEAASLLLGLFMLWRCLIRPLWKDRKLSFDGMLILVALPMWFYDPGQNYWNFNFIYNPHLVNLGSWADRIPGWGYPNGARMAEPILFMGGVYIWYAVGLTIAGCAIFRWITGRFSRLSTVARWLALYGVLFVVCTVIELFMLLTETWMYPAVPDGQSWLVLFAGTRYQYPLSESMCAALVVSGFTAIRWYRDDRGYTFAERGLANLRISEGRRRSLRLLSLVGAFHLGVLALYFIPYAWFVSLRVSTNVNLPSYYYSGMCGPGTGIACPQADLVPIPGRSGTMLQVAPDDPRLPPNLRQPAAWPPQ